MQIHEITTATHKIPKLNEGMMDTIKGYFNSDPSMANLDAAQRGQKMASNALVKDAADKGFRVWQVYIHGIESQITDPIKKKAFNDRTDGLYKKYLLSFVTQNMLGGKSLSTLINKNDIIGLVDEISEPMTPAATPYAINTAAVTAAVPGAKPKTAMQQIAAPTAPTAPAKNITTHTATPNNPNAVTEAALKLDPKNPNDAQVLAKVQAQQLAKQPAPVAAAPAAVSVPGAKPKTAMQQIAAPTAPAGPTKNITTRTATPNNPNQAAPALAAPAAAASPGTNTPAKQKEDFEKLVFASASAAIDSEHSDVANNPMHIALQLQKFGPQIIQAAGTNQVKSTGNTALDGTLKTMGFTVT